MRHLLRLASLYLCLACGMPAIDPVVPPNQDTAPTGVVRPVFDPLSPTRLPFPSDRFTVSDSEMLTRLRVNLPLPADCVARKSDCDDIALLNDLDGFSVTPRLSIPFDGDIDLESVQGNVSLHALGDRSSSPLGITQIVWDQQARTLYAKSASVLHERTRYALVITNGVRTASGQPIGVAPAFDESHRKLTPAEMDAFSHVAGLIASQGSGSGAEKRRIAAMSVFTTQSFTHMRDKITRQLMTAAPPQPADFHIGPRGTSAVFPFDAIRTLSHNQQTHDNAPPVPADVSLVGLRFVEGAVGRIAFGRFSAPDYMRHPGEYIPPIKSGNGTPNAQGTNTIYFSLVLPSGAMPARGWPVVIFGIGGNGNRISTFAEIAAIPASYGLAVLAIDNLGHGFGPQSSITIELRDGVRLDVAAPGRGVDQNGDGIIGTAEGHSARAPRQLSGYSDGSIQLGADHLSLIRVLQRGVDVDGDSVFDVDASRIYFFGQSLGAVFGLPFVAFTPAVRASVFMAPFGTAIDSRRLTPTFRAITGNLLEQRQPSLLNAPHGLTSVGGLSVAAPHFNENIPFPDQPPVVNTIPGALEIQQWMDRTAWRMQPSDAAAHAALLQRTSRTDARVRPTLVLLAKGDQGAVLVEAGSIVRAGSLENRTILYRHDQFVAANPKAPRNPHSIYRFSLSTETRPVAEEIQRMFSEFFAADGARLPVMSPYFEVPMRTPLPVGYDNIP